MKTVFPMIIFTVPSGSHGSVSGPLGSLRQKKQPSSWFASMLLLWHLILLWQTDHGNNRASYCLIIVIYDCPLTIIRSDVMNNAHYYYLVFIRCPILDFVIFVWYLIQSSKQSFPFLLSIDLRWCSHLQVSLH